MKHDINVCYGDCCTKTHVSSVSTSVMCLHNTHICYMSDSRGCSGQQSSAVVTAMQNSGIQQQINEQRDEANQHQQQLRGLKGKDFKCPAKKHPEAKQLMPRLLKLWGLLTIAYTASAFVT